METWLVTGARGFLGTNAGVLLNSRVKLIGQARTVADSRFYRKIVGLDLRDTEGLSALIRDVRPDVVLNAAAISGHETSANDPEQAFAVNVVATEMIAQVCAEIGARMVHISSDAVFAGDSGNYSEEDEPAPFSHYGETKLAGEQAVRAVLENHLIVRTNFFGWSETGRKSVLEFFVNSLRSNQHVRGYPDFIVTSLYVPALLEAIWRLGELGATGTFNIASADALSKYDFGVQVAQRFGLDQDLIARLGPDLNAHATSRSRDLSLNTSKITNILGVPMQTQIRGIAQAYDEESLAAELIRNR